MHLVVNQVVEFQHVHVAHRDITVEVLAGSAISQSGLARIRQVGKFEQSFDLGLRRAQEAAARPAAGRQHFRQPHRLRRGDAVGDGDRGLIRSVQRILPSDPRIELVLVIDQFEEIFTLVEDEAVREQFLNSLITAVLDPRSRIILAVQLADLVAEVSLEIPR